MFVKLWGTRGSIPTPGHATHTYGGNTSCVEVRRDDAILVCDAGTGIRELGVDLARRGPTEQRLHLFFSHTHWDHIQGFPFFGPAYDPARTLHIWDLEEAGGRVHQLLSGQMQEAYFPVTFAQLGARIVPEGLGSAPQEVEGVLVKHLAQPHPGGCAAFSFEADGRKVVYLTDSELDTLLRDRDATVRDPRAHRALPSELVEFVRGADLLVGDGQYTDEAYATHRGWGHPRAFTTVDLAVEAEVQRLAVFHHDPMETDADVDRKVEACAARARDAGSRLIVFGAREGLEWKLG